MHLPPVFVELAQCFQAAGFELALVGGAVRDLLTDRPPGDLDMATNASPTQVKTLLQEAGFETSEQGAEFGGLAGRRATLRVEITQYRRELSYPPDSRRPTVEPAETLEEDLKRRDLSVHAMALWSTGALLDPYGGQEDLEQRRLRVPVAGRARTMLEEDPLRILRVLRSAALLDASPDAELEAALSQAAGRLSILSPNRVLAEWEKLLMAPQVARGLELAAASGALVHWFPELEALRGCQQSRPYHDVDVFQHTVRVVQAVPGTPLLRWAALAHDLGKPATRKVDGERTRFIGHERRGVPLWQSLARRLGLPKSLLEEVAHLIRHHLSPMALARAPKVGDAALRRLAARLPSPLLPPLFALARADAAGHAPGQAASAALELETLWRRVEGLRERDDLHRRSPKGFATELGQRLGIPPGPDLGRLLARIDRAMLEGKLPMNADVDACVRWAGTRR